MDTVHSVLRDFVELGFVEFNKGVVVQEIVPIFNIYHEVFEPGVYRDRWELTVQYLKEYGSYHIDFEGFYFLNIYDGWREYSDPVDVYKRDYVPWTSVPEEEKGSHFTFGDVGEPRFMVNQANTTLYVELPYPILSYNRHIGDSNVLLIPDTEFLENGFQKYKQEVENSDIPYHDKISSMIWRGSAHFNKGYKYVSEAMGDLVTSTFCHPRIMALAISQSRHHFIPSLEGIFDANVDNATIAEMLHYKYQLDIDGMVSAWSGFFWKLYSNSAVIKGPTHWEQWYYQDLLPFEHYIPLKSFHPRDIYAVYEWCETNSDRCEQIGRRGSDYVRKLTYRYAVEEYVIH